ncbi:hypothetical protein [Sabulicella rubraurantiaca]|uniref:hypothetical protein n=1 Tax=Sabulicella rubraurantiaca TaxID=2811429 RepID=UPI001A95C13D|nr:hypothetical protein [Sabulicella rubraurantiaca]
MRRLAALLMLLPGIAAAQAVTPRLVLEIPGRCATLLRLGEREVPCAPPGAVYSVLEDGRAFVFIPFGPRSAVNFVGTRDRHPSTDSYALLLDYVRVVTDGVAREWRVTGECQARLSRTGAWTDLGCAGRTAEGALYAVRFTPR